MVEKSTFAKILSPLLGIVFLVSGIGKSLVAYEFSEILVQYGFAAFRYFAPLVIMVEMIIGFMLFFGIRRRLMSLISLGFVLILSMGFLYGHLFANITDCGCFGHFSFLNLSPTFTYLRNVVLMILSLYIFANSDNSRKAITDLNELVVTACVLCAVCFATGLTYRAPNAETTHYITEGEHLNVDVNDTPLGEFITPAKDSTYLVFAFSYTCPHCYNSIENLKQYERLKVVDKVLAVSFATDSATMKNFETIFEPNFQIINYLPEQLFRLTNHFPIAYYIENNVVKMEIQGLLPCGYLLQL